MSQTKIADLKIAVIGLGYVGLPLAVAFGCVRTVLGFDINSKRINALRSGHDETLEVSAEELAQAQGLSVTDCIDDLAQCNCYIITVPTPIDQHKQPDLGPLRQASSAVAGLLKAGDLVIYESTVYPGCTEEICVPILAQKSNLRYARSDQDLGADCFHCGYSPERINPGDKQHRISTIKKVTSGSSEKIACLVDELYRQIVTVGTHKAPSIRVAEAAKVIENTQRDLNIALINELAMIFNQLGIDTQAVLAAAGSKWNFLPFRPGLVGGHCIGVDPYYLTHKAQAIGYHPEVILAGRRVNDGMGQYVANQLIKSMIQKKINIPDSRILIMGLAFKENCPDVRNTRIVDVVAELREYGGQVDIFDPWVEPEEVANIYALQMTPVLDKGVYDAVIIAVAHRQFCNQSLSELRSYCRPEHIIYDLKYVHGAKSVDLRL